jgi:hypothetical protein
MSQLVSAASRCIAVLLLRATAERAMPAQHGLLLLLERDLQWQRTGRSSTNLQRHV